MRGDLDVGRQNAEMEGIMKRSEIAATALLTILFVAICIYFYADRARSESRKNRWLSDHHCTQISVEKYQCDTGTVEKSAI